LVQRGRGVDDDGFFPTFHVTIRSEDNRDQSRKLSEIARILDVFSPSQILGGGPSEYGTHIITPALRHVDRKEFREDTLTSPEVIVAHTLNFRPHFKFSQLNFLGGPPSQFGCALGSLDIDAISL